MADHPRMDAGDHMMHMADSSPHRRSSMLNMEILEAAPDWDRFVSTMDRLSRVVPRFRQRVISPTLPTTAPRWVVDPDFDISYHVRRVRLSEPGDMRQLLDLAEMIAASPLDPARPLWTATLVEGLEGGRAALLDHLSHVVTDGVGGVAMAMELYELSADAPERPMPPQPTPAELTPNELFRQGVKQLPGTALSRARALIGTTAKAVTQPRRSAAFVSSLGRVMASSSAAEPSPLLVRRGIQRRTITLQVELAALKAAGKRHGGSVNDAYLAGLTLGLQRYHEAKGVPVDTIPMAVPVNLRKEGDSMEGNAFTGLNIAAPIAESDLATRVGSIREQIRTGKEEPAVDVMGLLAPVVVNLPMLVTQELDSSIKVADVQASNVPSYPGESWIAGQKVVANFGLGPLPGVAMMATMISRGGQCFIAFRYDTVSFDDAELLGRCLREGYVEMVGKDSVVSQVDGLLPGAALPGSSTPAPASIGTTPGGSRGTTSSRAVREAVAPVKKAAKKAPAKKAPAKKAAAKKTAAKKTAAKAPAEKAAQAPVQKTVTSTETPGSQA